MQLVASLIARRAHAHVLKGWRIYSMMKRLMPEIFQLSPCFSNREDPNRLKRQKRQELKRAAEWENVTGVITGGQAALDKAVSSTEACESVWFVLEPNMPHVVASVVVIERIARRTLQTLRALFFSVGNDQSNINLV